MRRILWCTILTIILASGIVSAAPQIDFEQEKTSIDIGVIRSELETSDSGGSIDWDKKSNLDFGITTGLSEKVALQYKYQNLDSGDGYLLTPNDTVDSKVHELNVLCKLDSNFYAFLGVQRLSGDLSVPGAGSLDIDSTTVAQIGVTGTTNLADKLTGWATAAVGNDNYSYEIGLGYEIADNTDINLFYRYKEFSDLEFKDISGYEFDAKSKGFGAGVTFKF
ncbi:outer membrane protein [Acetonema longum]|uniref:OmpA/MotB domain protein n=1 Tax=Acetonema longum DSM 6540 TaxID=1009370 RepID=F7NJ12_9FIRM|nr:outer membrane beta-barrel protein [Acetonema longum]EGO64009.1 OmpA/MotB domain protein [Acetonema longum DSM 6540]